MMAAFTLVLYWKNHWVTYYILKLYLIIVCPHPAQSTEFVSWLKCMNEFEQGIPWQIFAAQTYVLHCNWQSLGFANFSIRFVMIQLLLNWFTVCSLFSRRERNRRHAKMTRDRKKMFLSSIKDSIAKMEEENNRMRFVLACHSPTLSAVVCSSAGVSDWKTIWHFISLWKRCWYLQLNQYRTTVHGVTLEESTSYLTKHSSFP